MNPLLFGMDVTDKFQGAMLAAVLVIAMIDWTATIDFILGLI